MAHGAAERKRAYPSGESSGTTPGAYSGTHASSPAATASSRSSSASTWCEHGAIVVQQKEECQGLGAELQKREDEKRSKTQA